MESQVPGTRLRVAGLQAELVKIQRSLFLCLGSWALKEGRDEDRRKQRHRRQARLVGREWDGTLSRGPVVFFPLVTQCPCFSQPAAHPQPPRALQ